MVNQKQIWDKEYLQNKNKWNKETINLPKILRNKCVLELGVGNGKTLKSILKQNPKLVTAIDFSKQAIEQAKSNTNNKIVKFIKSDVRELPFPDSKFDIVVCYYILNNLIEKDRKKAVSELYRLLKPKGKILFQDFALGDYRQKGEKVEKNTVKHKNGIMCHFFTDSEINDLFKDFSKIDLKIEEREPIRKNKKIKRRIISAIISKQFNYF